METKYKTIFIDWDGTLTRARFWGHWATGENAKTYEIIQERFFATEQDFLARWMRGGETAESCATLLSGITGLNPANLLINLEISCKQMQFISESLTSLIHDLRRTGVKVVIATDNMDTFGRWTVPALGLRDMADSILDSYSLHVLKKEALPSGKSAFFSAYLESQGIQPGETLLLDDNAKNKRVEDFGINFIQVTNGNSLATILDSLITHCRIKS